MTNRSVMLLCLLLCLTGISLAQRAPRRRPAPPPPPEQLVKQTVQSLNQAWAANDADGIRRACTEDVVLTEAGRRLRTLQTVIEYVRFNAKHFPAIETKLGPIETHVSGTTAWAHADTRSTLTTPHGLKLHFTGYSSYVLQRQRRGWKIALMDFDLKPMETAPPENPVSPAAPGLEGMWMLESTTNLKTGQPGRQTATLFFTKTRFSFLAAAPDRRQPKDKQLPDYSRKELQEITRDLDATSGTYRREGDKVIVTLGLTLLPNRAGEEVTLENVTVTADRMSYEVATPDGRLQRLWRRIE